MGGDAHKHRHYSCPRDVNLAEILALEAAAEAHPGEKTMHGGEKVGRLINGISKRQKARRIIRYCDFRSRHNCGENQKCDDAQNVCNQHLTEKGITGFFVLPHSNSQAAYPDKKCDYIYKNPLRLYWNGRIDSKTEILMRHCSVK